MMWRGIFALFFRSLRSDSRAVWIHASWFFLLVAIYVALCVAQAQSLFFGAPGLLFFRSMAYCNSVFVTLLGISYFSSVISEEKEEDTLGLMTMAGINPLGILLGKSTTRLFQVFLLLAVQYPFTLLAITLGGLTHEQIYSTYAALLAYIIFLANLGLFCSVLSRTNRNAAGLTTLVMVGYFFLPMIALSCQYWVQERMDAQIPFWIGIGPFLKSITGWLYATSIFIQLNEALTTEQKFMWTPQLISNGLVGIVLFFVSWGLFGVVSHETTESATRAMVPRRTGRLGWLSAGRTRGPALAWKDFHFIAGGWSGILIRCTLYSSLYWLVFLSNCSWTSKFTAEYVRWNDVTWGYEVFVVPLFTVDCALCLSRLFQEEIRQQTLASLLMLPRSVPSIFYSKLAGCVARLIPGAVAVVAAFFWLNGAWQNSWDSMDEPAMWWFVANLLLIIHLCAMLSLYLRWGAFGVALALTVGSMIVSGIMIQMLFFMPMSSHDPDPVFAFLAVLVFTACVACHFVILLRLPTMGEK